MRILAIETSCDETAVAIIEAEGNPEKASFSVLGNALFSQTKIHEPYGGVFPMLAKRAHAENLVPLLITALKDAFSHREEKNAVSSETEAEIQKLLEREPGLFILMREFLFPLARPRLDVIAVTYGPGLEPALWVGINFAKALALLWDIPVIPVNHMEGHIFGSLLGSDEDSGARYVINHTRFPLLALLISGGHTELVLMQTWSNYELLGETRDDAVGEAFDKVARLLDLPYPGGPEISRLAKEAREKRIVPEVKFPRPMMTEDSLDFSFSGLKTAVLYHKKNEGEHLSEEQKLGVAREFEEAVTDVLIEKTRRAAERVGAQTLLVGGGVSANAYIREQMEQMRDDRFPEATLLLPGRGLATDNAVMIGIAGAYRAWTDSVESDENLLHAKGNLKLSSR